MSDENNQAERRLAALNQSMPFSDEAEKGLLSCLLQDPSERVMECQRDLMPEAFYHVQNRTIYELLLDMQGKNEPIDPPAVTHRLRETGKLEEVGGAGALTDLFAFVPISAHYPFYKKTITEKWLMRQLVEVSTENMQEAFGHGSVAELEDASQVVARAEERIFKVLEAASANKGRKIKC
jgi:replicative DNA helicase